MVCTKQSRLPKSFRRASEEKHQTAGRQERRGEDGCASPGLKLEEDAEEGEREDDARQDRQELSQAEESQASQDCQCDEELDDVEHLPCFSCR